MKKYIINSILIGSILSIFLCIIIEKYRDNNINNNIYNTEKLGTQENLINIINIDEEEIKQYPKEEIEDTYKGYEVCAKLDIPSIELEVNILSAYSKKALEISATKFWGVNPNEKGNFCIAGHNKKSMFYNIKKLEIGDTFFITDRDIGKVEYEIFDIYKVSPEDVSCLEAITDNIREVTLITCTNDSKSRFIIKAMEKE